MKITRKKAKAIVPQLLSETTDTHSSSYTGRVQDSNLQKFQMVNGAKDLIMHIPGFIFRWFKFTLKPPCSITHGELRLAIWDTSFWTFWLKFGHKGP